MFVSVVSWYSVLLLSRWKLRCVVMSVVMVFLLEVVGLLIVMMGVG